MLDELATFERHADIEQQVRVLNRGKDQSIDAEWEVAVLYGLSRSARVDHHAESSDGVQLDALVSSRDSAIALFAADIAAVSESGRRDLNPVDYLHDELLRRVRRTALRPDSFSLHHEGRREGPPGKEVMRLLVPSKRDVPSLFDEEFAQFLRACLAAPDDARKFRRVTETVDVEIGYNPAQRYFTGGGPAFEASYSLTKNPVHNALIRKAKQLRRAAVDLPVGIILCAVDTSLSDKTPPAPAVDHSAGAIVRHFLHNNRSISFVVTLEVTERYLGYMRGLSPPTIKPYVYLNPDARGPRLSSHALRILDELAGSIPRPINTGMNALHHLHGVHPTRAAHMAAASKWWTILYGSHRAGCLNTSPAGYRLRDSLESSGEVRAFSVCSRASAKPVGALKGSRLSAIPTLTMIGSRSTSIRHLTLPSHRFERRDLRVASRGRFQRLAFTRAKPHLLVRQENGSHL
jgi:hypothetical protein